MFKKPLQCYVNVHIYSVNKASATAGFIEQKVPCFFTNHSQSHINMGYMHIYIQYKMPVNKDLI
jgi:hypothetical protein